VLVEFRRVFVKMFSEVLLRGHGVKKYEEDGEDGGGMRTRTFFTIKLTREPIQ
jgi:hypothetical protein